MNNLPENDTTSVMDRIEDENSADSEGPEEEEEANE